MKVFNINPDICRAETLPSDFYTDDKYFRQSKEKIFARTWQLLGTTNEINNVRPYTLLEDFLDEPILVSRNGLNFHCLSNVCTHRGKILVEEDCQAKSIRCGYHGRKFDLAGKFLSMPEFEDVANFPNESDDLSKIPFAVWGKFLFVSLNPFATLEDFLRPMQENVKYMNFENLRLVSTKDYFVKAHWALYCENYLEGFHIPFVHQSLNEEIDFRTYTTETFRYSSLQTGFAKSGSASLNPTKNSTPLEKKVAAYYFFVFPNLMFNFYPWGLSLNVVKPLKNDLTKVSYLTFVSDESKLNQGAGADLGRVEIEDQAVVESVQKGINSRYYHKGRYSSTREKGTHHFHQLITEFMGDDSP